MHTGFERMFADDARGRASVIDPAKLRWIGFSHFESDECGALNEWLRVAPHAQAVCSFVGAKVMVNDFAERPARALADGEVLEIGRHRLRFLATPHVPHGWDAGLFFEETDRTLLCSDLFFQPGDPEPLTESDIVGARAGGDPPGHRGAAGERHAVHALHRAHAAPARRARPRTLAVMHGISSAATAGRRCSSCPRSSRSSSGDGLPAGPPRRRGLRGERSVRGGAHGAGPPGRCGDRRHHRGRLRTMRDVLLNRHPIFRIADPVYLFVICAGPRSSPCSTRD